MECVCNVFLIEPKQKKSNLEVVDLLLRSFEDQEEQWGFVFNFIF